MPEQDATFTRSEIAAMRHEADAEATNAAVTATAKAAESSDSNPPLNFEGVDDGDGGTGLETLTYSHYFEGDAETGTSAGYSPPITVIHPRHYTNGHRRLLRNITATMARISELVKRDDSETVGVVAELQQLDQRKYDLEDRACNELGNYIVSWEFVSPLNKQRLAAPRENPQALHNLTDEDLYTALLAMQSAAIVPSTKKP